MIATTSVRVHGMRTTAPSRKAAVGFSATASYTLVGPGKFSRRKGEKRGR